jgi:thiamine kinase-like enzyme
MLIVRYRRYFPIVLNAIKRLKKRDGLASYTNSLKGPNLSELNGKNILKSIKMLKMMAKKQAKMHKYEIRGIESQKDAFKRILKRVNHLSELRKSEIMKYLELLPEGNKICHNDFHPENIILSKNKLYVVDWANSTSGNPNGDVARTLYLQG